VTLRIGQTTSGIVLVARGPFDLDDGLFVASHEADLFGGATQNWTVKALGASLVSISRVDFKIDRLHHIGLAIAAQATFSASDESVGVSGGPTAVGSVSTVSPNGTVQAQPESVDSAQAATGCMVNVCGASNGSSSTAQGGLVLLLAGVLVLAGAVVAVLVLMTRAKPRRPTVAAAARNPGPTPTGTGSEGQTPGR
jgi:hypothetical protein